MKSGKVHTADTTVLERITWPHEVVYTSAGRPVVNENMRISLSGYLIVMAGERDQVKPYMIQYLQELMDDAELYGWSLSGHTSLYSSSKWNKVGHLGQTMRRR